MIWTPNDEAYLKAWYGRTPAKNIAHKLGRGLDGVYARAKKLGLCSIIKPQSQDILQKLLRSDFKLAEPYRGSSIRIKFVCPYCQNEFMAIPRDIVRKHTTSCGCCKIKQRSGTKDLSGAYLLRLRKGAINRNIRFEVTNEELQELIEIQNFKCSLSNRPLVCGYTKSLNDYTASLDRIDPKYGYIPGNIQWVHKQINLCKQKLNNSEFIALCKDVAQRYY